MVTNRKEASLRFMGLNSVGVDERDGGDDQIQNPKASLFITFDALVITKDSDAATDTVVIYVKKALFKKAYGSVNCVKRRKGDGDGKRGCYAIGDGGSDCLALL